MAHCLAGCICMARHGGHAGIPDHADGADAAPWVAPIHPTERLRIAPTSRITPTASSGSCDGVPTPHGQFQRHLYPHWSHGGEFQPRTPAVRLAAPAVTDGRGPATSSPSSTAPPRAFRGGVPPKHTIPLSSVWAPQTQIAARPLGFITLLALSDSNPCLPQVFHSPTAVTVEVPDQDQTIASP